MKVAWRCFPVAMRSLGSHAGITFIWYLQESKHVSMFSSSLQHLICTCTTSLLLLFFVWNSNMLIGR